MSDNEEKYRLIFEHAPLGALHFNRDGIITACNEAFVDIIGSTKDALIGLNMLDLPDKKVVAAVQEALAGKDGFYSGHYQSFTANKTTPVRVFFRPFINAAGETDGGVGIVEDTSLHEQSTINIAQKQAYFEQLFQTSPEGIVILNKEDCIIRSNNAFCEMFGYTPDEIVGKPINSMIVPDELANEASKLTQQAVTGIVGHETVRQRKDGTLIQVSILAKRIELPGGKIELYGIYRDISKRKEIERELIQAKEKAEESDQLKTAFLNNLSHEVRTPLNAITGFSVLLKEQDLGKEKIEHLTDVIQESSEQLLTIIDSIVRISAIETGLIDLYNKTTDIPVLLDKVYRRAEEKASRKFIKLRYHSMLRDEERAIQTDESKLFEILTVFVDNAIKYTEKGHVEFGCQRTADQIRFYVADTGSGINKEHQKVIFERFRKADLYETNIHSGMGLGLPIAKAYIDLLGGEVWLDSSPGIGSTFYFTIPYEPSIEHSHDDKNKEDFIMKKGKTVLVAEDEEYNFYLTKEILTFKDIKVLHAWNGEEAVRLVKENPDIGLIFMDIKMPVMGGFEATRLIKQMRPDLPVVALTAYALIGDREKALENGCDEYLSKPVSLKDFEAVVDKFL